MAKVLLNGNEIFGNVHMGEGGDVANPNIADVYDPTQTYNTGDRRIYDDVLYVCNDDNVTGDWDSTKWDSATIDEIISALTASDIPYSAGVSVADKLDNVPTFDTLTTGDNNKLLGVSVSGDDISVGAVGVSKSITPPTGAYINSKLTNVEFFMTRQGRLVCMSLIFQVSSNLTAQEDIFTSGAIPSNMDNQQFVATIVSGTDMGKCGRVMLKDNGSLSDWYNGGSFFTTGKTFLINATYLCK